MIVPSRRLLLVIGIGLVPLCGAFTLFSGLALAWSSIAIILCAVLIVDARLGIAFSQRISVAISPILLLARDRAGVLELAVANEGNRGIDASFAVAFPSSFKMAPQVLFKSIPAHSRSSHRIAITASERGNFKIADCDCEFTSPLGLWLVRRTLKIGLEARVYPNLARNATAVRLMSRHRSGFKSHQQIGRGREFEKLRDYSAGDAFDEIHWKATARRSRPIVKVFQIERAQQFYVLIDTSCHSKQRHALDYFVEAALVLGLAAENAGDQFGVLTFSDRVHQFVRANSGSQHYSRCRGAIYDAQAQPVSADFPELAAFLQTNLRKRALLFLLTNLDDAYAIESLLPQLRTLRKRHLIVTASLAQPFANPVFDGPLPESMEDVYSAVAGHLLWRRTQKASQAFHSYGTQLAVCTPENIYEQLTDRYFLLKKRQLL
jgi:uncharacterized protein (DUF58 family)